MPAAHNAPSSPATPRRSLIKRLIATVIIIASLAFLVYYWRSHPAITEQLKSINPLIIIGLVALYLCMTAILTCLYAVTLRMCGKRIPVAENTLLTMYSSVINFFGPLQSGPGFRALYLKKKHAISIKSYTAATLLYYALFALCNSVFLLFGIIPLRFAPLVGLALVAIAWLVWRGLFRIPLLARYKTRVDGRLFALLALITLGQALLVVLIYFIELHTLGVQASLSQTIVYSGAANLALFVSLTPGALGFRESFLYLSQKLHHIPNDTIIAANVLDRAVYVAFLLVLLAVIVIFHAGKRLDSAAIKRAGK